MPTTPDYLRMIIDAERKAADDKIKQLKAQHELELNELKLEHQEYKKRRDAMDYVWTGIFITLLSLIVLVRT